MDSDNNQNVIYCPEDNEFEYIVIFVINFVSNNFIKTILNHNLMLILFVKDNNQTNGFKCSSTNKYELLLWCM